MENESLQYLVQVDTVDTDRVVAEIAVEHVVAPVLDPPGPVGGLLAGEGGRGGLRPDPQ